MACEIVRDDEGKVVAIACGSPWGIGTYKLPEEYHAEFGTHMYGFPPRVMNPHDFRPDAECCTEKEIAAWKEACDTWDKAERGEPFL